MNASKSFYISKSGISGGPTSITKKSNSKNSSQAKKVRFFSFKFANENLRSSVMVNVINSSSRVSPHFPSGWQRLWPLPCRAPRIMIDIITAIVFIKTNFPAEERKREKKGKIRSVHISLFI